MLESTDNDNKIINSAHIRMRGIPTSCIKYEADKNDITGLDVYIYIKDYMNENHLNLI